MPPKPSSTGWGTVFLVIGSGVVAAFQVGKVPVALPALRAELGLSLFGAGWVISIFSVIGASSGVLIGAVADWIGHRRLLLIGLSFVTIGSAAGTRAPDANVILITRVVEGVGFLAIVVAAPALISRIIGQKNLRLAIGLWSTYMPIGSATMMLVSPLLIALCGWRGLWLANAVIGGVFLLLLGMATPKTAGKKFLPSGPPRAPWPNIKVTLSRPGPLLLACCMLTFTVQFMAVTGFLPTFLMTERGLHQGEAAMVTALSIVISVPGSVLAGWLLQRGVPRWILISAPSAVMALSTFGIYSAAIPDEAVYALCLLFYGFSGILPAAVLAGAPIHAPSSNLVGTTNGIIMQGSHLGHVIGPPVLAVIVTAAGGWHHSPLLFTIAGAVAVAASLLIRTLERQTLEI